MNSESSNSMSPDEIQPLWVETKTDLETLCAEWRTCPAIGVDTEFVRERTFFPGLGLIQVSDEHRHVLIDPLAIEDLEALAELLADPNVIKIFHSCSEDLEVLYHRFGMFPHNLFDSQIAAAFAGHGYSMGYSRLVEHLFEVHLPKGQTRTNWLRRPLSEAQTRYAALDTAFLIPIWKRVSSELVNLGRLAWAEEEFTALPNVDRFLPDPETLYLKIPQTRGLSRRKLALLKDLYCWREREARRRDLPRNFVLPESSLLQIAQKLPRHPRQLKSVDALRPADLRRYGEKIVQIALAIRHLEPEQLPETPPPEVDLSAYRKKLKELRQKVLDRAAEIDLPPELLATTKHLKQLLRRHVTGAQPVLPEAFLGWRKETIGSLLLKHL